MPRDQLTQQLLETMTRVLRGIAPTIHSHEGVGDLTRPQTGVLFTLYKTKDKPGLKVKDIADRLGVTSAAITQVTNDLVDKGLLERTVNEDDRREVNLSLTKKSEETFKVFRKHHFDHLRPFFDDFSDDELGQFIYLLGKIKIDRK